MVSKYRLSPKPGLLRSKKLVKTQFRPTINSNAVKVQQKISKPKKLSIGQDVEPNKINQVNIHAKRNKQLSTQVKIVKPKLSTKRNTKPSKLRSGKEAIYNKSKDKINAIRNCGIGRVLIMVACGPSVLEVDFEPIKNNGFVDFMTINKPYKPVFPTKYWVFCDQSQYLRNKEDFESYNGTPINAWSVKARHRNQLLIRHKSGEGFSKNLTHGYYIGRSTTYANMQTAYWMNYDRVYIFGVDMCQPVHFGDQLHHYGKNPDVEPKIRQERFKKEAAHYMVGAKALDEAEKKKFTFCSSYNTWPFTDLFPRLDHKKAVDEILSYLNGLNKQK